MEKPEPSSEHLWLQRLVGEWSVESECLTGPDQPPMKWTGTETGRSLGGLWTVGPGKMGAGSAGGAGGGGKVALDEGGGGEGKRDVSGGGGGVMGGGVSGRDGDGGGGGEGDVAAGAGGKIRADDSVG